MPGKEPYVVKNTRKPIDPKIIEELNELNRAGGFNDDHSEELQEICGDGVDLSVHAPEDEFASDSDEDFAQASQEVETASIAGPSNEFEQGVAVQEMSGCAASSTNTEVVFKSREMTAKQKMAQVFADNPEFYSIMERMVDSSVNKRLSDSCQTPPAAGRPAYFADTGKTGHPGVPPIGVKSPSDTTIYAPAIRRVSGNMDPVQMINKISEFVEGVRAESTGSAKHFGGNAGDQQPSATPRSKDRPEPE